MDDLEKTLKDIRGYTIEIIDLIDALEKAQGLDVIAKRLLAARAKANKADFEAALEENCMRRNNMNDLDILYTEHCMDECPECGHLGAEVVVSRHYIQVLCEECGALIDEIEAEDPPGYEEMVRY